MFMRATVMSHRYWLTEPIRADHFFFGMMMWLKISPGGLLDWTGDGAAGDPRVKAMIRVTPALAQVFQHNHMTIWLRTCCI